MYSTHCVFPFCRSLRAVFFREKTSDFHKIPKSQALQEFPVKQRGRKKSNLLFLFLIKVRCKNHSFLLFYLKTKIFTRTTSKITEFLRIRHLHLYKQSKVLENILLSIHDSPNKNIQTSLS